MKLIVVRGSMACALCPGAVHLSSESDFGFLTEGPMGLKLRSQGLWLTGLPTRSLELAGSYNRS